MHRDFLIYFVHALAWGAFGLARLALRGRTESDRGPAVKAGEARTAPHSRALVGFHMAGFGVMYFGLGDAVIGRKVPELFALQRPLGALVILTGSALMCWAIGYFRSWRFEAKLEAGHELATGGPFRLMRHPIYAGIDLLALGTALWVPTGFELAAVALLALGGDLRARAEEKLLRQAFGEPYRALMARTKRFVPGIY